MSDYGSTPPPPPPPSPAYGGGGVQGAPPPNYLVWSILSIFLCWPIAIPSIIFANQVNSKWAMGDAAGAQDASKKAKTFALVATILGGILIVIAVVGNVLVAMNAKNASGT